MNLTIYLAGQIHDNWRDEIKNQAEQLNLPLTFVGPMTDHDRSDNIGEEILGKQPNAVLGTKAPGAIKYWLHLSVGRLLVKLVKQSPLELAAAGLLRSNIGRLVRWLLHKPPTCTCNSI